MQKVLKRIVLALTLCLAVICASAFTVGCGGGDDASNYTVTILYPDKTPVNGQTDGEDGAKIYVQWCIVDANGNSDENSKCSLPVYVDTNGKATVAADSLPELGTGEKYHVLVNNIANYTVSSEVYMSAPGSITITLVAKAA